MSANQKSSDPITNIERRLDRIKNAERRKLKNENILYLEKNGDIGYETVRSYLSPVTPTAAESNLLPNNLPHSPLSPQNGNLIDGSNANSNAASSSADIAESQSALALATAASNLPAATDPLPTAPITCHDAENPGNQLLPGPPVHATETDESQPDPLTDLLSRALAAAKTHRGRPSAFDDRAKGQLVALLSVGMSMRQAAAVLGVSHTTIQNTLKADPSLTDEITSSRFEAQLQPLACVIREARRSWKAATWLLKYLDAKIATHDETPDERHARQEREAEEFFAREPGPKVKTRKMLG